MAEIRGVMAAPPDGFAAHPGVRQLPLGVVMLDYRFGASGRGGRAL